VGAVTSAGSVQDEAAKKVRWSRIIRRVETGEAQAAEVEGEGTLLGEAERFAERSGIAAAASQGLGGRRKGEVAATFAGIGLTGPGEGADGLDDFVGGGFPGMEISDLGKKERSRGEGIPAPRGASGGGDGDQTGGVVAEKGAGGVRFGKDPAEVGVTGAVADVEEDGAGKRGGAVRGGGDFGSEDGLKAGLPGGEEEFNAGMKVRISQPDGGKTQFGRPADDRSN
jgi:hypothetical protein